MRYYPSTTGKRHESPRGRADGRLPIVCSALADTRCHATPGSYVNEDGQEVHWPVCAATHQESETAICNDGSHSFSRHHAGAPVRIMAESRNGS
ncbi:DUF3761 domain-containing protein [Methylovirgula ligni]|uniref:DUF3761 domain-containing protein n=1 Tax=Methylovirgula ligni TaxID=569860 RepID=UPI003CCA6E51